MPARAGRGAHLFLPLRRRSLRRRRARSCSAALSPSPAASARLYGGGSAAPTALPTTAEASPILAAKAKVNTSSLPDEGTPAPAATATGHQPSWVEYDRKVLRFYACFKEAVNESRQENYRIRKCIIYYYLEDSIHVYPWQGAGCLGRPRGFS